MSGKPDKYISTTVIPGQCELIQNFISASVGDWLFQRILEQAKWETQNISIFNKTYTSPRLSAWYGDENAVYQYSGIKNVPLPWFDEISLIKSKIEVKTQNKFNSVLLNQYRNGADSMGSHSDDEAELGSEPVIASLSLGATRRFILHPKRGNQQASIKIDLAHGSLLMMRGQCQQLWKHAIPKTRQTVAPRINLTYRMIKSGKSVGRTTRREI